MSEEAHSEAQHSEAQHNDPEWIEATRPILENLRADLSPDSASGAWGFGLNRSSGERYLFGVDPAGREFALRFEPDELERFLKAGTECLNLR